MIVKLVVMLTVMILGRMSYIHNLFFSPQEICSRLTSCDRRNHEGWGSHTERLAHTEKLLRREAPTHRNLCMQTGQQHPDESLHTEAFSRELLCTIASTQRSIYTQEFLIVFAQICFYTEKSLHKGALAHRNS